MSSTGSLLLLVAASVGVSFGTTPPPPVTPVGKVVKLLQDLKSEVTAEGIAEASTYDDFACFCRSTTSSKSTAIKNGRDTINTKASTIESKTATKKEKVEELRKRQKKLEEETAELAEVEATYAKDKASYDAKAADLSKAISSLVNAIQSMTQSKPSFLAIREKVVHDIQLAGVMNLIAEPKRRALDSFLQNRERVDPQDAVFKYHSQGIIDVMDKLLVDFRAEKTTLDTEFGKTTSTWTSVTGALGGSISTNNGQITTLEGTTIPTLTGEIATARTELLSAESVLKDDQAYLQDLTELCETRANDWDQRSQMRATELSQLQEAISVLQTEVVGRDTAVNKRALLIQSKTKRSLASVSAHSANPVFFQQSREVRSLGEGAGQEASTMKAKQEKASALLQRESGRLHSMVLSSVAVHLESDPFLKVKNLIQALVERLLKESTAEATKKGYCDKELGEQEKTRKFKLEKTQDLTEDIKGLELKEDELETEIQMLTDALRNLRSDLSIATGARDTERTQNLNTIKEAKAGLAGVKEALVILKVFYKQAAKATVFAQASPVDDDTNGTTFAGAYKGKQESSKAILGLLEVIVSDFDRTIRVTDASEKKAEAEYVEFDRSSRADISGKEEKKELDNEDLTTTQDTLARKLIELQTAQDLLDQALREIVLLKPTCIDTGMTYEERVAKREDEIAALKKALCILDPDDVEQICETLAD